MARYIWQHPTWPSFRWDANKLLPALTEARFRQGQFLGIMRDLGIDARLQSELEATSEDVVKTSAIEGEVLNPASVRSSIARRLGMPDGGLAITDRKVEGVVDMILDATKNHGAPLTEERIFGWHAALFPTGYSGTDKIDVGQWRTDRHGAMQVVSQPYSPQPKIHFEAPPAARVPEEMAKFLAWFNVGRGADRMDPLIRAGIAHLWFVTIHPMDDGNGRIARAIADLAVAQMENSGQRFYSMSSQIAVHRSRYYEILEETQKGDLDITDWLSWFSQCYTHAISAAEATADKVIAKAKFWHEHTAHPFSDRQRKVLGKLLDGFEGAMTTKKWMAICGCSADTAQRDINDLIGRGLLAKNPGGSKNTSYQFVWREEAHHGVPRSATASAPHALSIAEQPHLSQQARAQAFSRLVEQASSPQALTHPLPIYQDACEQIGNAAVAGVFEMAEGREAALEWTTRMQAELEQVKYLAAVQVLRSPDAREEAIRQGLLPAITALVETHQRALNGAPSASTDEERGGTDMEM